MKCKTHLFIRKSHRYLGLILGIQFVLWTAGGLYFRWSKMDEIHGDNHRKAALNFKTDLQLVSPAQIIAQLPLVDSVKSIRLIEIFGKPVYQLQYFNKVAGKTMVKTQLAIAATVQLRSALTRQEAVQLAINNFIAPVQVSTVEYLTEGKINRHHKYRDSPLPAWAVTMSHPSLTTVYVAAEQGQVTKFRNNKWRIFDFLWSCTPWITGDGITSATFYYVFFKLPEWLPFSPVLLYTMFRPATNAKKTGSASGLETYKSDGVFSLIFLQHQW